MRPVAVARVVRRGLAARARVRADLARVEVLELGGRVGRLLQEGLQGEGGKERVGKGRGREGRKREKRKFNSRPGIKLSILCLGEEGKDAIGGLQRRLLIY